MGSNMRINTDGNLHESRLNESSMIKYKLSQDTSNTVSYNDSMIPQHSPTYSRSNYLSNLQSIATNQVQYNPSYIKK